MLGDNMSVVLNTSVPSSVLKKKHNAIAYHRVQEAIAARVLRFDYLKSEENVTLRGMTLCVIKIKSTSLSPYDKKYFPGIMNTYFTRDRHGLRRLSGTL